MKTTDSIFNEALIPARMDRARRIARKDANFLSAMAMEELADRLAVTNRDFTHCLLLSQDPAAAEVLKSRIGVRSTGMRIDILDSATLADPRAHQLQDETADLVVSPFGLHRINDLPGALVRFRRVLKPDGLFLAAIPGDGSYRELRDSLIASEASVTGGAAMRVDPFVEIRQAGSLLQRAGFSLPVTDVEKLVLRYHTPDALIDDLRAMASTSILNFSKTPLSRQVWQQAKQYYRENFADADGKIRASLNVIYLTGWTPHESQQKPLKPGSAKVNLSRALKDK
ncbi:MAG: methyltransferase domain-containing protein [Nitratireductor sp.]